MLRRSDVPLEAVDHHNSRIFTPLLSDEAVLDGLERLSEPGQQFESEDPQSIIRHLMCVSARFSAPPPGCMLHATMLTTSCRAAMAAHTVSAAIAYGIRAAVQCCAFFREVCDLGFSQPRRH
jgi:hypothetical protein